MLLMNEIWANRWRLFEATIAGQMAVAPISFRYAACRFWNGGYGSETDSTLNPEPIEPTPDPERLNRHSILSCNRQNSFYENGYLTWRKPAGNWKAFVSVNPAITLHLHLVRTLMAGIIEWLIDTQSAARICGIESVISLRTQELAA